MNIDQIPHTAQPASRRIDINAGLPNLILGSCYGLAAFRGITLPFMDRIWLGTMMGIEFLVIHSFPFMMFLGSAEPRTEKGEKCRRIAFWGLFVLYFAMAAKMGGFMAVISFASLTVATYLGYLLRRTMPGATGQLVLRWLMSFLVFMVAATVTDMPESVENWFDHSRVLAFGMSYFLILGLLELFGFYHSRPVLSLIENFAQQWKRDNP